MPRRYASLLHSFLRDPLHVSLVSLAAIIVSSSGLLTACGGDDDAASDPDPLPVAQYCPAWSDAACSAAARCSCGVDAAACAALAEAACPLAEGTALRIAVDDGTSAYDEVAGARFVRHLRDAPCTDRPLSCGGATTCIALAGEGEACAGTESCDDGLACSAGACVRPGDIGAACGDNLACRSGRCAGAVCTAPAALGAACEADAQCATARCDFATGRCRDLEPLDALCTRDVECMSGYCERVMLAGGHCHEPATLVPRGEACTTDGECADGACIADRCAAALCDELM